MRSGTWTTRRTLFLVAVLAVSVALALVVARIFLIQNFYAASDAMAPTVSERENFLIWKFPGDLERGDTVLIDDPGGWLPVAHGQLFRRVIGIGGDSVRCCDEDGELVVNGEAIAERYVRDESATAEQPFEVEVKQGFVWVMGDNRAHSVDSRARVDDEDSGQVSLDMVVGTAWLRIWPLDRFGPIAR